MDGNFSTLTTIKVTERWEATRPATGRDVSMAIRNLTGSSHVPDTDDAVEVTCEDDKIVVSVSKFRAAFHSDRVAAIDTETDNAIKDLNEAMIKYPGATNQGVHAVCRSATVRLNEIRTLLGLPKVGS